MQCVVLAGGLATRMRPLTEKVPKVLLELEGRPFLHYALQLMAAQGVSQVVLALQLPLAMFPLLHFTSSRKRMGKWKLNGFLLGAGWTSAILITAMDLYGLPDSLQAAWHVIVGD